MAVSNILVVAPGWKEFVQDLCTRVGQPHKSHPFQAYPSFFKSSWLPPSPRNILVSLKAGPNGDTPLHKAYIYI